MSINRKLKKYVDEMPAKKAEEVLPKEAFKAPAKSKSRGFVYAGVSVACAAVVGVAALGLMHNSPKQAMSENAGVLSDIALVSPEVDKKPFSDGEIKGEHYSNGDDYLSGEVFEESGATKEDTYAPPKGDMEAPEMAPGVVDGEPGRNEYFHANAGTLTGGEMRDLLNWDNYLRNLNKDTLNKWFVLSENRISVYLHNGETPLCGVRVSLLAGQEEVYSAVSDVKGNAYLFYNFAQSEVTPDSIRIYSNGEAKGYLLSDVVNSKHEAEINLDKDNEEMTLDLMFMVDTTGSMGDELNYLKAEVKDVIERVETETGKKIRTSVNFYRDNTDEYVVKYYDFREDAKEVQKLVEEQYASGGGDFPEAVAEAFDNALNAHNWDEKSIKLMFVVLDAPPHDEKAEELSKLIKQAAEMGVRIIPVMSSGADEETVCLFRSYAVMTGGTYLFLDDNSGVGGSHEIPSDANDYDSEYLNDMMIRVIGEYVGVEIDPNKVEITPTPTPVFEQ